MHRDRCSCCCGRGNNNCPLKTASPVQQQQMRHWIYKQGNRQPFLPPQASVIQRTHNRTPSPSSYLSVALHLLHQGNVAHCCLSQIDRLRFYTSTVHNNHPQDKQKLRVDLPRGKLHYEMFQDSFSCIGIKCAGLQQLRGALGTPRPINYMN